jgi:hypothetical protein
MLDLTEKQKNRWICHRFIKKCLPEITNDESVKYIIRDVIQGKSNAQIKEKNEQVTDKTILRIREAIKANNIYAQKFREVFKYDVSNMQTQCI